jgi:hypothetical protein
MKQAIFIALLLVALYILLKPAALQPRSYVSTQVATGSHATDNVQTASSILPDNAQFAIS